jgi:hypothetical protein
MADGYWTPWHLADALRSENEAKAAVIAAMEDEVSGNVAAAEFEREACAKVADERAEHHAKRAEEPVSFGGPALHRRAAGSYRALAAAIRARGGK